jgi:hypothetical protein
MLRGESNQTNKQPNGIITAAAGQTRSSKEEKRSDDTI